MSEPIEGGAVNVDCSLPPDHPERVTWRSLTNDEMGEQKVWKAQSEQAERAHLRIARNSAMRDTLHLELLELDEGQKADLESYRAALRDLPIDELPELPAIPESLRDWL